MALLETKNLHTYFKTRRGTVKAVNGVSYSIEPGKTLGVVGESGSGKSVSAMSILRLLDGNGYIDSGEIFFDGKDLTKVPMNEMYHIRGNQISVIFQEPMTALNPVFSVERQLSEPFLIHRGMSKKERLRRRPGAGRRENPQPGGCGEAVSPPAFRRYAPARHDCHGVGPRAEAVDCG